MRTEKVSLRQASREHGVSPATVLRHGKAALRKTSRGTYAARARDRLLRVLVLPTPTGLAEIATLDSRAATVVAEYWNTVNLYLETGEDTDLQRFRGQSIIDAEGKAGAAAHRSGRTGTAGLRRRAVLPVALREGQLMARRSNDPIKAGVRKRNGSTESARAPPAPTAAKSGPKCWCVESPKRCLPCYAVKKGRKPTESHHIAAEANSPITVEVPITDHRKLSDAQYEWPPETGAKSRRKPVVGRWRGSCAASPILLRPDCRRASATLRISPKSSMHGCANRPANGGRTDRF